jgi:AraC-like DNA-binding protein
MVEVYHRTSDDKSGLQTHYHNADEIIFILSGKARFTINTMQYEAQRGSLLFISSFETHMLEVEEAPYERYYAIIDRGIFNSSVPDPILSSVFRNRPADFSHMARMPEGEIEYIRDLFNTMYTEFSDQQPYWQTVLFDAVRQLLICLFRNFNGFFPLKTTNRTMEAILAIQKHIEECPQEDFSLSDAARLSFLEMHYLSRLFRETTGFTFQQYRILQRLTMAKGLLADTQESVGKIAENTGFDNTSHFIRIFRKTEGITPGQYRRRERIYSGKY